MTQQPALLLASSSPRRRQLLGLAGWEFQLLPVEIDETPIGGEPPEDYVLRLARNKARASASSNHLPPSGIVLAADTTVADEQGILAKPEDPADAARMLERLRARTHSVYTALAVFIPSRNEMLSDLCCTRVTMRDYSPAEVAAYIDTGDPLDKAGAYAIQHAGFHPVEKLDGCYANVVGLPLCLLNSLLSKAGLQSNVPLPLCPHDYLQCPICSSLARGENAI